MNAVKTNSLTVEQKFSADVMLDKDFLLLPYGCVFTEDQIKDLSDWGFEEIYTSGKVQAVTPAPQAASGTGPAAKAVTNKMAADIDAKTETVDMNDFMGGAQEKPIKQMGKAAAANDAKGGTDAADKKDSSAADTVPSISSEEYENAKVVYRQFAEYISAVYTFYATNKSFRASEITQKMSELCDFVRSNRRHVLRIISTPEMTESNFLVNHSIRSTIVSVAIAQQLQFPEDKQVELATACMLHEIGMILLPPQLYIGNKTLSQPEKVMMNTHPIVSFNILKQANFSLNIQIAVLEHHERMNGAGYPRHVTGDKISLYARIIALACSFEAISAPREYRDERSTFDALIELVRNSNRQYDDTVTKALLYSISLYPIGVYVYLSNGKIAQVVDVSEGNPKSPFVQVIGTGTEEVPFQVDGIKMKIMRVLNKNEVDDMLKAIKKMAEKK
ncbi:MAG: HD-GYP domain-containing protein [Treponema sp.]|nr:HD-GYP domain-containing protein [Treponema sp.]